MSIVKAVFPHRRERAYLSCVPYIQPTASPLTTLHSQLYSSLAVLPLHFILSMSRNPPLTYTQPSTENPRGLKRAQPAPVWCYWWRKWPSLQGDETASCPQLVQLQLVRKFHLGFHCLPHSIPYSICNSLSEAHHSVSPLFLSSSPGLNAAMGKVWTASRINTAPANISAPPPPEAVTLL